MSHAVQTVQAVLWVVRHETGTGGAFFTDLEAAETFLQSIRAESDVESESEDGDQNDSAKWYIKRIPLGRLFDIEDVLDI